MLQLAIAAAALILLATGIVLFVNYRNRRLRQIGRHAADILQDRFRHREKMPVENLVDRSGLPGSLRPRARKFVERLAAAIEVDPGQIRLEDRVSDLVTVKKEELGAELRKAWDEEGLDDRIGDTLFIFAQDVFEVLMKTYKRPEWKVLWAHVPHAKRPSREGDWLALIIDRSVKDLIDVFEKGGEHGH